jgi:proteasome accessory factor B
MAEVTGLLSVRKHNRLRHVHRRLLDRRPCTLAELASELGVSEKTVQRLLADLKDLYGAKIDFTMRTGYTYTRQPRDFDNSLAGVQTTEPDRVHLGLAVKALEYLNLKHPADEIRRWLRNVSGESLDLPVQKLDKLISFVGLERGISLTTDIHDLLLAILNRHSISFRYKSPRGGQPGKRRVNPYHLAFRESTWYLVGWAHDHKAVRTYALSRMAHIERADETFSDPGFDPGQYFKDGGIVQSGRKIRVHLRFAPSITELLQEKVFHFNYTEPPHVDRSGRLHMKFTHHDPEGLTAFVLSHGPNVRVMAPESFASAVRQRLEETLGQYHDA